MKATVIRTALHITTGEGEKILVQPASGINLIVYTNRLLKRVIRRKRARMFYLDHVESDGRLLFQQVVKMDLGRNCLQTEGLAAQSYRTAGSDSF